MQRSSRIGSAYFVIGRFLCGQSVIHIMNLTVGIALVRLLPLEQYALYIIASLLVALLSLGGDMGIAQAVNTLVARHSHDATAVGRIFSAAVRYRRMLFLIVLPILAIVTVTVTRGHALSLAELVIVFSLVLLTGLAQQGASVRTAVLNAHHDSAALLRAGTLGALTRLCLIAVCLWWPHVTTALLINLAGTLVSCLLLTRATQAYLPKTRVTADDSSSEAIRKFVIPLVPGVIYYLVQGQIATFLLSLHGYTTAVAETGALTRLGQLLAFLSPAFGFFVQPHFARIANRSEFKRKLFHVCMLFSVFSSLILLSAFLLPHAWLLVLGPKYDQLTTELPLALAASLLTLLGTALYTIVISRNYTRGQSWNIAIGVAIQVAFLSAIGVHSTSHALLLTALPALGYVLLQCALLFVLLRRWGSDEHN